MALLPSLDLVFQVAGTLLDDVHLCISRLHVKQDISEQERVFALDDLRPADVSQLGKLLKRNLLSRRSRYEDTAERLDFVS